MNHTKDEIRTAVRKHYGRIARNETVGCCGPSDGGSGCCGQAVDASLSLGYTAEDLDAVPEGANLGLGCGNPQVIAGIQMGETVLDLGSGGGFDALLAATRVGPTGSVIGVDMTPDMVSKARENAKSAGAANVEFRLGEIESLPVAEDTVDVILSNCVINLSPDKSAVFREAFRVLKPGGRLAITDVVATASLPEAVAADLAAYTGCVSGAEHYTVIEQLLAAEGFNDIRVVVQPGSDAFISEWIPGSRVEDYVASATIEAVKPDAVACCGPSCCGSGATA